MQLIYKGVDIYSNVRLKECVYENYCCNHFNYLRILFEDDTHVFDSFDMKINDEIRILEGSLYTGVMYINKIKPVNCGYEIIARSVKSAEWNFFNCKTWSKIHFKQLVHDIAQRHDMGCEIYGIEEDFLYNEKKQENEFDFSFIGNIAELEGCVVVVYDNKIIVSSEKYLESQTANSSIKIDSGDINVTKNIIFPSCTVTDGNIIGTYRIDEGTMSINKNFARLENKGMADRYAKNILRQYNKNSYIGTIVVGDLMDAYSAGSVVNIVSSDYATVNGKAFIYRLRNDLVQGKSKIWFRKCLNGY